MEDNWKDRNIPQQQLSLNLQQLSSKNNYPGHWKDFLILMQNIKIDSLYDLGCGIKCEVISLPKRNKDNQWEWTSKNLNTGKEIGYLVDPNYTHYSSNLYDYEAYKVKHYI